MENDILSKVIEVEKSIQERLNEEKEKSLEWIEAVRQEAREEIARKDKLRKPLKYCAFDLLLRRIKRFPDTREDAWGGRGE